MTRRLTVAAFSLTALSLIAASPVGAGAGEFSVSVAKQKDGPYGNAVTRAIPADVPRSLWFRVTNNTDEDLTALIFDDGETADPPAGMKIKWFRGKKDVTHDVQTGGYLFGVREDKSKYFRARVKANTNGLEHCLVGRADYQPIQVDQAFAGLNAPCT